MQHIFEKGTTDRTLLLLHGTGGTEHDLLGLARKIDADANLLSVRGNVSENGMARFFRRIAEGVFDMEDLKFRTAELNDFLDEASDKYEFNRKNVVAIGYSNGANIAGALLFYYGKDALAGALLHHPMVPDREAVPPLLKDVEVWIGAGTNDPLCPPKESEDLAKILTESSANVQTDWFDFGHQLTMQEVEAAKLWYDSKLLHK